MVPVRFGGVLDELRRISELLAGRYGWQPAQATAFVLCDVPPVVDPVQVTTVEASLWHPASRIRLAIDPLLPVAKVASTYRKARASFYSHGPQQRQNYSEVSEKVMALALFAYRHSIGFAWNETQQIWYRTHPDWAYTKAQSDQLESGNAHQRNPLQVEGFFNGYEGLRHVQVSGASRLRQSQIGANSRVMWTPCRNDRRPGSSSS